MGLSFLRGSHLSASPPRGKRTPLLIVWLAGGASFKETFNPDESGTLEEFRGPFRANETKTAGVSFCELFTWLRFKTDEFSLLRAVDSGGDGHSDSAQRLMGVRDKIGLPSVWGEEAFKSVPYAFIHPPSSYSIMDIFEPSKALFAKWNEPSQRYEPPSINPDPALSRRKALLDVLDSGGFGAATARFDKNRTTAFFLNGLGGSGFLHSFRLPEHDRIRYGMTKIGDACLLATRFIQAGAGVAVVYHEEGAGWDMHYGIADRCKAMCPPLDVALFWLVHEIAAGDLNCNLLVMGEIGRTPKLNSGGGRDHWGKANCAILAGPGFKKGVVYGRTDKDGEPKEGKIEHQRIVPTIIKACGGEVDPAGPQPVKEVLT
jgi:hypothetical protein